jgi:predicted DCC family thiol-disulfide oxidoreductase YuxK
MLKNKKYLVSSKECPYCIAKIEKLKSEIARGEIIVLDIDTPKGIAMVKKLGLGEIPSIIECKKEGRKTMCTMVE